MPVCRFLVAVALLLAADDPTAPRRERMVSEQIQSRGIRNPDVLRAMRVTPRHLFVPPEFRFMAYDDHPAPIGYGATISQPYVVAWMTELLAPSKKHRVLEIGTGSGYAAAVLAEIAKDVYTVERIGAARGKISREARKSWIQRSEELKGLPDTYPFGL